VSSEPPRTEPSLTAVYHRHQRSLLWHNVGFLAG
jgi:hypothetical protein